MSYTIADLGNPSLWEDVSTFIGRGEGSASWYDLNDRSHAIDVVQTVCTELRRLFADGESGELLEAVSTNKVIAGDALVVLAAAHTSPETADLMRREILHRMPGLSDVVVLGGVSSVVVADSSVTKEPS